MRNWPNCQGYSYNFFSKLSKIFYPYKNAVQCNPLFLSYFFPLFLIPSALSLWSFTSPSFFQWATVTFHLPHHVLKLVASTIVSELKKINQNVAALSVASSIMDRLSYLLSSARPELGVGPGRSVDRWASRKKNVFVESINWTVKHIHIHR